MLEEGKSIIDRLFDSSVGILWVSGEDKEGSMREGE